MPACGDAVQTAAAQVHVAWLDPPLGDSEMPFESSELGEAVSLLRDGVFIS